MTFVLSKLFWILAAPGNLLVLALCASAILLFTGRYRAARWLVAGSAAAMAVIAVVPVGEWLLIPLENRFPAAPTPARLDGIIVLGGGISPRVLEMRGRPGLNEHGDRLFALAALVHRFPDAKVIYTGGDASLIPRGFREADAARRLMVELGLDTDRTTFERESRNTYENVLHSRAAVAPASGERWLLATSAFHMPRAVGIFRQQDWPVIPYPVDYLTDGRYRVLRDPDLVAGLSMLNRATREWIGLIAYHWLGYTGSVFPGPEQ